MTLVHELAYAITLDACFEDAQTEDMKPNSSAMAKSVVLNGLGELRDQVRERRQARVAYDELQRELAAYRTPSEIGDLLAAVDRHSDAPHVEQVRQILGRNLADYRRRQRIAR